jgi:hypothetical protein
LSLILTKYKFNDIDAQRAQSPISNLFIITRNLFFTYNSAIITSLWTTILIWFCTLVTITPDWVIIVNCLSTIHRLIMLEFLSSTNLKTLIYWLVIKYLERLQVTYGGDWGLLLQFHILKWNFCYVMNWLSTMINLQSVGVSCKEKLVRKLNKNV